jgi:hypothetical protein
MASENENSQSEIERMRLENTKLKDQIREAQHVISQFLEFSKDVTCSDMAGDEWLKWLTAKANNVLTYNPQ